MLVRLRALPWLIQFLIWLAVIVFVILILGLIISSLGGGEGSIHIGKFFFDIGVRCASNCG